MTPFEHGKLDALKILGMDKVAKFYPSTIGKSSLLQNVAKGAKQRIPKMLEGTKRVMIGDPKRVMSEFNRGGLKRLFQKADPAKRRSAGIMRESMSTPDLLSKALFYGVPAVEAGGIALDNEGDKGRRIGETVGSAALGMAAWKPFGILGSMALDPVGRGIGGSIGSLGDAAASGLRQKSEESAGIPLR